MTTLLDLDAIRRRATFTDEYLRKDPCDSDGFRPLSVREHFTHDVPALIAELGRLRDELTNLAIDCEDMPEERATSLMFVATAARIRLILAGARP